MTERGSIIVVDDDNEMREMVTEFLSKAGYQVTAFPLATKAFEHLKAIVDTEGNLDCVDLVLSDIQMPEMDGIEFVERMKRLCSEVPVILITAFGSIESAIEATRVGAYDYIVKPFKLAEVEVRVARGVQVRRLKMENQVLRTEVQRNWSAGKLIGKSKAMHSVFELVDRVSKANANVLITGESGTGKEMVARAIHEGGPRANRPFVAINCTAIPETLLESELFGHAKGSFTGAVNRKRGLFEEAEGGTLFLDEIGDLDMALQAKLLRVLQERKIKAVGDNTYKDIDVRIVAATHKDLSEAIKDGRFREDLYYRLAVIPIHIPPLRHRKEDIPILARFFLQKYGSANNSPVKGFSSSAVEKLMNYRWDGNVRELENIIERVVVLSTKEIIDAPDLPVSGGTDTVEEFFATAVSSLPTVADLERRYIKYVLDKTGGRKEKASQILGINRRTLYRKEREYGFVDDGPKKPEMPVQAETSELHRGVESPPTLPH
ncbi:MAG: sigma-54-dependent Fis family transcriptional regulator [Bdellovibrionaceae bacterium]|nr:sigma-54-dependent Fis family transcriptional regulator [Bdellovibrionales bacterium]MCB9082743.1 sigma-54-dependent Fis family transcriptional regulator [Pseudobdellovibrionaceae bacterium]